MSPNMKKQAAKKKVGSKKRKVKRKETQRPAFGKPRAGKLRGAKTNPPKADKEKKAKSPKGVATGSTSAKRPPTGRTGGAVGSPSPIDLLTALSAAEAAFVCNRMAGKSQAEAARLAGFSIKGAAVQGHRLQKRLKGTIDQIFQAIGLDDEKAAARLNEAVDATAIEIMGKGELTLSVAVPDWQTRLNALDKYFKIKGLYKQRDEEKPTVVQVSLNVPNPHEKQKRKRGRR